MPIDPRIAMGYQAPQIESPLNMFAKYQQIQSAQQANELARMQAQEYERGLQEQEGLRNYLAGKPDLSSPEGLLRFGKTGAGMAKTLSELAKERLASEKTRTETEASQFKLQQDKLAHGIQSVGSAKSATDVMAALDEGVQQGYFTKQQADAQRSELASLQTMPEFQAWQQKKLQGLMSAKDQLEMMAPKPQLFQQTLGNVSQIVRVNPREGAATVVPGSQADVNLTPGQIQDFNLRQQQMQMQARLQDPYNLTGAQGMVMPNALPSMAAGVPLPTAAAPVRQGNQPALNPPVPKLSADNEPVVVGTGKVQPPKMSVQQAFQAGLTGDEFISTLPAQLKEQVKGILEHRISPPGQNTARGQQLMQLVSQADPTFDAKEYKTQSGFQTSLSSGHLGKTLLATSTAIDHLSTLEKTAKALENNDTRVINTVQNYFNKEFGGTKVTDFEAVKKIVGDEVNKAVIGGVGAVADRQEIAKSLSSASSPAQLAGIVSKLKELMAGRVRSMEQQYNGVMHKDDFYDRYVSPEVRDALGVGNKKSDQSTGGLTPEEQAELSQLRARFPKKGQ
jgi:plasmid maintenance system killer protein